MTFIRSSSRPGRRSGDAGGVVLCASETLQPTRIAEVNAPAQPGQLPTPTIGNRRTGDPSRPCAQLATVLGASPRPFANVFRGTYGAATSVEASPAASARPLEPRFPAGTSRPSSSVSGPAPPVEFPAGASRARRPALVIEVGASSWSWSVGTPAGACPTPLRRSRPTGAVVVGERVLEGGLNGESFLHPKSVRSV